MTRWLVPTGIGVAVVALVAIALLRDPVELDSDTPEGTVQEYLQAISDEDYERAFELVLPESAEGCDASDLAVAVPREPFSATLGSPSGEFGEDRKVAPGESDPQLPPGETALVDVTLRFAPGGGPFDTGWEQFEKFRLLSLDGSWWITDDPWPYFTFGCREHI